MSLRTAFVCVAVFVSYQTQAMGGSRKSGSGEVFERFVIPHAKCGDGSEYPIYIRKGDSRKVLIHLQGGGACWNKLTCSNASPLSKLDERPDFPGNFYLGPHLEGNPFNDFTYVYVPYCTGDIFAGSHVANYKGKTVHHMGHSNFKRALAWIESNVQGLVSRADDLALYGDSAGGLGVMLNLDQVAALARASARKLAVIDSPGLHFNSNIWGRFSSTYLQNVDEALERNSISRAGSGGILAPELKKLCQTNSDWKIGVLQASQDVVMSMVFGNISTPQHWARVMGKRGLHQALWDPADNCASWIPDTPLHIFGTYSLAWKWKTWSGLSAGGFVRQMHERELTELHPSHH